MDNVTHTLVGLAAGELIHRTLPKESSEADRSIRRRLLLISCAVASNFPDLDLVLSPLLPPPLGYLLHHRGHTHTVLYAIPQALLFVAVLMMAWSRGRDLIKISKTARMGFGVATAIGFSLHLSMDYLNSYGIHPFHPFDSRWFFGDMIFIIEPLFWVASGAPLVMMIERSKIRIPAAALLIGLPALFAANGFLAWYSVLLLAFTIAGLAFLQKKDGRDGTRALITGAMVIVSFIGLQSFASGIAKKTLANDLLANGSNYSIKDVAATPLPTNPFCWSFVSVESDDESNVYRLRRGLLSIAESVKTSSCPLSIFREAPATNEASGIEILDTRNGSLTELRALNEGNCHVNAWFRFARAPFLQEGVASDLRFHSKARVNFTSLRLADFEGKACPELVPQWLPPRSDFLQK